MPLTTGSRPDLFGPDLAPYVIGPFRLSPVDARDGDRIVLELGSRGPARIETRDDGQTWATFSSDILFEDLRSIRGEVRQTRRIGKCIYCGRSNERLSREHVVPEGLDGDLTLTAASCGRCGTITAKFERDLLRDALGPARIGLRLRTKRPDERPTHLPLQVERAGKRFEIPIAAEDYPAAVVLPIFPPPGYLSGRSPGSGIQILDVASAQLSGIPLAELHRKYGYDYTGTRLMYRPVQFARAIAKIGYGFAVLRLGLERFAERYVVPAVLGEDRDIGHWVGCDSTALPPAQPALHALTLHKNGKEIHTIVRLFAQFGAPEYRVVVGRIR